MAPNFDRDVDWTERLMFLKRERRRLCAKAKGHVLEVGAGTGRNVDYFKVPSSGKGVGLPGKSSAKDVTVKSLTFVDQSSRMLDICSKKWEQQHPDLRRGVRFVAADAGVKGTVQAPPGSGGFDTILQTMGLCSVAKPIEYLKTMQDLLRRPEPDGSAGGRILLLEHGRGHYDWINRLLDGLAKGHADRYGCWWNRDIAQIVIDSGLKVVSLRRRHFGTTWILELEHPDVAQKSATNGTIRTQK